MYSLHFCLYTCMCNFDTSGFLCINLSWVPDLIFKIWFYTQTEKWSTIYATYTHELHKTKPLLSVNLERFSHILTFLSYIRNSELHEPLTVSAMLLSIHSSCNSEAVWTEMGWNGSLWHVKSKQFENESGWEFDQLAQARANIVSRGRMSTWEAKGCHLCQINTFNHVKHIPPQHLRSAKTQIIWAASAPGHSFSEFQRSVTQIPRAQDSRFPTSCMKAPIGRVMKSTEMWSWRTALGQQSEHFRAKSNHRNSL